MKREMFKDVEVNGRQWRVGRFDALTGSYITALLLMQMLPMGVDSAMGSLPEGRSLMNRETFTEVQKECLKVVSELKEIGNNVAPIPAMLPDGRWGVDDLETDITTVIPLTIHALAFNLADFFQEGALNSLGQVVPDLRSFDVKG